MDKRRRELRRDARELRKRLRPIAASMERHNKLNATELFVLVILSMRPGRDPSGLASALGMRRRPLRRAWDRLVHEGLIAPRADDESDREPVFVPTQDGKDLASEAILAAEVADFEPDHLSFLREENPKAPF